jgi:hypothetical protein
MVAEGCRTTEAAVAGEPAVVAAVAAAAAAAPGATVGEGAAVWAASTPAGADTATKGAAKEPAAELIEIWINNSFFMSFCLILSTLCSEIVFHNVPHFSCGRQKSGTKITA